LSGDDVIHCLSIDERQPLIITDEQVAGFQRAYYLETAQLIDKEFARQEFIALVEYLVWVAELKNPTEPP
jgi:hypothetical protein